MQSNLNYSKFPFLAELGLSEMNMGCYRRGEWVARGKVVTSLNPHTNEKVAQTTCSSVQDYQECVQAMAEERDRWQTTPGPVRGEIVR